MINVFFPYYQCGDSARQREIDLCLKENGENPFIDNLIVVIDDGSEVPLHTSNMRVIYVNERMTYALWIDMTNEYCDHGVSVLCNSDIYFDDSILKLRQVLRAPRSFLALSRWELIGHETSKHPNPHWSQDTWAMNVGETFTTSFKHQLAFPMGVPRCDNKVAYLFAVQGWSIHNPVNFVKSIHVHETQVRTYNKKIDERILGGVSYVHPGAELNSPASLDFDIWVKDSPSKINGVKINSTLERWRKEAAEVGMPDTLQTLAIESVKEASAAELLHAIENGSTMQHGSLHLNMAFHGGKVYPYSYYEDNYRITVREPEYKSNRDFYKLIGYVPPVMTTFVDEISDKAKGSEDINFWQYPCATEKQAYENHLSIKFSEHVDVSVRIINIYVPLPWATYIDKKQFPQEYFNKISKLLAQYQQLADTAGFTLKSHSVCQHIHWARVLKQAETLGITDLYLSHKNSASEATQQEVGTSLNLHGWSLIAVNYETPERSEGMERKPMEDRKLLASFIGAHMNHYRDDKRVKLFEAAKETGRDDVFVDLGDEWHFNKVVYEEQVLNKEIEAHHIDEHHKRTFRYNSILSDSKFSFCPEGAGPNTLRFWESIAVGTIPVIFSDDLAIFTESDEAKSILDCCVIWKKDIASDLFSYLSSVPVHEVEKRAGKLVKLYEKINKSKTISL
ncbi:exostosin family protein [Alteromonas sp. NFXS44]|uniref:exostosin domain-containing protein n=1 Tax=Alteromonas sp. NFXS44 TaxID=2818435 RepID=UPI0032DE7795